MASSTALCALPMSRERRSLRRLRSAQYKAALRKLVGLAVCVMANAASHAQPAAQPDVPQAWKTMAARALDSVYPQSDRKRQCWLASKLAGKPDERWCMRVIDSQWGPAAPNGDPTYLALLVGGQPIDDPGQELPTHAMPYLVGAFLLQREGNQWRALLSQPRIEIGSAASPPAPWQYVQFGPNASGWVANHGDCHQGYCQTRTAVIAPKGRGYADIGFVSLTDMTGACTDTRCETDATQLKLDVSTDESTTTALWGLQATLSGRFDGRTLKPRSFKVPFDAARWRYVFPRDKALDALFAAP